MTINEAICAAREQHTPQILVDALPFVKALGIEFTLAGNQLQGQMDFARRLVGDIAGGALHGGSISSLLESTAIFTLLWELPDTQMPRTINSTIEFLCAGRPKPTRAHAQVTRHGRHVAKVLATAWQEEQSKPIAIAHTHFLLVPSP